MGRDGVEYTIVIPVYNEEENLEELCRRIEGVMVGQGTGYEVIFVNDGSTDSSIGQLTRLHQKNPCFTAIDFSRNFGRQMALTAGIDFARGAAVILMDGDLQHPPELIPELIKKYKEGYNVVYTTREYSAAGGLWKKVTSALFYRFAASLGISLVPGATEFMLIDAAIVQRLRESRERFRFLRGIINWLGFKKAAIPYVAAPRYKGKTKFTFLRMVRLAFDGIFSFSSAPLYIAGYVGLCMSFGAFVYAVYALYISLIKKLAIPGWTSVMLVLLLFGGIQLMSLGILGAYVGRIYEELKLRPLYVIKQKIGME